MVCNTKEFGAVDRQLLCGPQIARFIQILSRWYGDVFTSKRLRETFTICQFTLAGSCNTAKCFVDRLLFSLGSSSAHHLSEFIRRHNAQALGEIIQGLGTEPFDLVVLADGVAAHVCKHVEYCQFVVVVAGGALLRPADIVLAVIQVVKQAPDCRDVVCVGVDPDGGALLLTLVSVVGMVLKSRSTYLCGCITGILQCLRLRADDALVSFECLTISFEYDVGGSGAWL